MTELEKRIAQIDAMEPEELDSDTLLAMEKAEAEDGGERYTIEDIEEIRKYNGYLSIRIPKELHRILIMQAKENGTSLNQYVMYCLATKASAANS